ncbi:polysaccharide deacetylase family protein [Paenibacillus marinisediminis]
MLRRGIAVLLAFILVSVVFPIAVHASAKPLYKDSVAVLMYHHIHDQNKSSSTIETKLFREQLMYLKKRGFHFISMREFRQYMNGAKVPPNAVLVTFDDGYESFYTHVYPILKEFNIPAVNFYITKHLKGAYPNGVPHMRQHHLAYLKNNQLGNEVQCHTHNMHHKQNRKSVVVRQLAVSATERESRQSYHQRLITDTSTCIKLLSPYNNNPIDSLSYPFGQYSAEASRFMRMSGIRYAFTIEPGLAVRSAHTMFIPRINAGNPAITPAMLVNKIAAQVTRRN